MYQIAMAATLGAVAVGAIGWLGSGEKFNVRKFTATVITAVLSGASIAVTFANVTPTPQILILALLSGAGIDSARTAISNAIAARVKAP